MDDTTGLGRAMHDSYIEGRISRIEQMIKEQSKEIGEILQFLKYLQIDMDTIKEEDNE